MSRRIRPTPSELAFSHEELHELLRRAAERARPEYEATQVVFTETGVTVVMRPRTAPKTVVEECRVWLLPWWRGNEEKADGFTLHLTRNHADSYRKTVRNMDPCGELYETTIDRKTYELLVANNGNLWGRGRMPPR